MPRLHQGRPGSGPGVPLVGKLADPELSTPNYVRAVAEPGIDARDATGVRLARWLAGDAGPATVGQLRIFFIYR